MAGRTSGSSRVGRPADRTSIDNMAAVEALKKGTSRNHNAHFATCVQNSAQHAPRKIHRASDACLHIVDSAGVQINTKGTAKFFPVACTTESFARQWFAQSINGADSRAWIEKQESEDELPEIYRPRVVNVSVPKEKQKKQLSKRKYNSS